MSNVLHEKSYKFALDIVKLYETLNKDQKEYVLSKQLLRSGTSIGANIAESHGAISKSDFSAKLSIAYKECLETKYWLNLLKDSGYISGESFNVVFPLADELAKILFSIINTTRLKGKL